MSLVAAVVSKTAGATVGVASGAVTIVALAPAAPSPAWLAITVAGIPLGVLCASLAGSTIRAFRDGPTTEGKMPRQALGALFDGFIGGWGAMLLLGLPSTRVHFDGVSPAVVGAACGLIVQFARDRGAAWAEQLFQVVLSWIPRRGGKTP